MFDAILANIETSTPAFLISQALVGIALCVDIASFQVKERRHVVTLFAVSCAFISVHLVLLEHLAGALVVALSGLRFFVSRYTTHPAAILPLGALSILAVLSTYTFWGDFILLSSTVFAVTASLQKSDLVLRILMFATTLHVVTYYVLVGSPVAVGMELVFLSSNIVGLWRHYGRDMVLAKQQE